MGKKDAPRPATIGKEGVYWSYEHDSWHRIDGNQATPAQIFEAREDKICPRCNMPLFNIDRCENCKLTFIA
jgi:hypothetical protein